MPMFPEADITSFETFFSNWLLQRKVQAVMGVCFAVSLDYYCQNRLTDEAFNNWWR